MNKSLARFICVISILNIATPAFAEDSLTPESVELKVSKIGDLDMSCASLAQETILMKDIMVATQDIKDSSNMQKHGITAVGAVGSFLVGTVTGGIGLAAAGFLLDHNVGEKSENAESIQDIAQQRRTLMLGIHHAKGCYGPPEYAMMTSDPQSIELASMEPAGGNEEIKEPQKPRYNQ